MTKSGISSKKPFETLSIVSSYEKMRLKLKKIFFPQEESLELNDIGLVSICRSPKAQRLSIAIKARDSIKATVPRHMPLKEAKKWISLKAAWIRKQIIKLENTERIEGFFTQTEKKEAKRILVSRLGELAAQHDFSYNKIFIRNQKTRWGSCSRRNNINLNLKLVRIEPFLRDYVILHELVHTRIKNHSIIFWEELARHIKNPKNVDKQLKKYRLALS